MLLAVAAHHPTIRQLFSKKIPHLPSLSFRHLAAAAATAATPTKPSKKRKRRKKAPVFATTWPFDPSDAPTPSTTIPNAGAIFCAEPPHYLGPIPPSEHHDTKEVAFVGRSNVGKSTLVGELFQQPHMVRSSKTPGRTRDTLFFALGDRTLLPFPFLLVDLPGYGYARAGQSDQEEWEEKMATYLTTRDREHLKRVFVLLDARREGMTERDVGMANFLNSNHIPFQLILTKCDAVHSKEVERVVKLIIEDAWSFQNCVREIIAVSAKKKRGLVELREACLRSVDYTGT